MRKLISINQASLDGVMQSPGGPQENPRGGFELVGWIVPYWDDGMAGRCCRSGASVATGLTGIVVVAEEPAVAAQGYAQLLGECVQPSADGLPVETGSAPVTVGGRERFAERLRGAALPPRPAPLVAALFIKVADRVRAAAALRGGLAPVELADGSCAVGADRAHGVALVFG